MANSTTQNQNDNNDGQESELNRQKYDAIRERKNLETQKQEEREGDAKQKEGPGAAKVGTGLAMQGGGKTLEAGGKVAEKAGQMGGKAIGSVGGAATGATAGAIGGAISGGIAGLAAGGIGAIPGALAGAGQGAVSGAKTGQQFGGKIGGLMGGLPGQAMQKTGQGLDAAGQKIAQNGLNTSVEGGLEQAKNRVANALNRAKNNQAGGGIPTPPELKTAKEGVSFIKSFAAFVEPTTAFLLTLWLFIELLGVKEFIKGGEKKPFSKLKFAEIVVLAIADIIWLTLITLIIILIYKILNGELGFWTLTKMGASWLWALVTGGDTTRAVIDSAASSVGGQQ